MKRDLDAYYLARDFAVAMEQDPLAPIGTFAVDSASRGKDKRYEMLHTPEGFAVHQGCGCEAEFFKGVTGCPHFKAYSVSREDYEDMNNTALTTIESKVPERIDFSEEQLKTISDVICVDSEGNRAPAPFVQLFLGACRHTGLDPFLRQIYALSIKGKWTMFVGIDGYRVISERTGLDQGMDGPQWSDDGKTWFDFPPDQGAANYCRVGIWRKGVPRPFVAVLSLASKINANSDSWKKDPNGMLAVRCEALARRRAFPADMAALPSDAGFEVEDVEGAPLTRAEVPEGQWTEIAGPTPEQHEATQQAGETAPTSAATAVAPQVTPSQREPAASSPACDHKDSYYNEQTTMLTCRTCNVVLEEPPADAPKQRAMV